MLLDSGHTNLTEVPDLMRYSNHSPVCQSDWSALVATTDFALYEAESAERVTIYCERRQWQLVKREDIWFLDSVSKGEQDTLEKWLGPRYKSSTRRGFCPAVLRRVAR